MSRLITVSLDKRGVSCVARMLDEAAPRTCAAVWDALPLSAPVFHGKYARNEIYTLLPAFAPADASAEQVQQIRQAAWGPLAPWSSGAYGNFLSEASAASIVAAYPGETHTRLARIKAIYDPENLFDQNLNIQPASTAQG